MNDGQSTIKQSDVFDLNGNFKKMEKKVIAKM